MLILNFILRACIWLAVHTCSLYVLATTTMPSKQDSQRRILPTGILTGEFYFTISVKTTSWEAYRPR